MKDNNTITGVHFKIVNGEMEINPNEYNWHIPKDLRSLNIEKGDIVLVATKKSKCKVLVIDVFREDIEETGKIYKPVVKIVEKTLVNN
jgi:formylmethanofuran dehydrogenase subunit D